MEVALSGKSQIQRIKKLNNNLDSWSTSHDPEKQELYAMKKLKLLIGAESP